MYNILSLKFIKSTRISIDKYFNYMFMKLHRLLKPKI